MDQGDEIGISDQQHQNVLNQTMAPTASRRRIQFSRSTELVADSGGDSDECGNRIPFLIETNDSASADQAIAAVERIFSGTAPLMSDGMELDSSSLCRMNYNMTYVYDVQPLYDNSTTPITKPKWFTNKTIIMVIGSAGALFIATMATLLIRFWIAKRKDAKKTSKVAMTATTTTTDLS